MGKAGLEGPALASALDTVWGSLVFPRTLVINAKNLQNRTMEMPGLDHANSNTVGGSSFNACNTRSGGLGCSLLASLN